MNNISRRLREEFKEREARQDYAESHLNAAIALQIKALRLQRPWTQQKLAAEADLHQSQISAMEQTNYEGWTIATLKKFASAFDLPLSVHFQSWGELIDNASKLGRQSLERPSFDDDPAFAEASSDTAPEVVSKGTHAATECKVYQFPGAPVPETELDTSAETQALEA